MSVPAAALPRPNSALTGIVLVLLATACFAALDTTAKWITGGVPLLMALWFRYFVQAVATSAVALPLRGLSVLRTVHWRFLLLRGTLMLVTSLLAFASLRVMPVAEFTAIVMITPLAITVLAATALKEKVSLLRWTLVGGGFAGTMVIIRPGGENFDWTLLMPLCMVATNAWFQTLTSKLAKTEDPLTMHFYTGWFAALLGAAALPFVWETVAGAAYWIGMVAIGLLGAVGHFMLIVGYARTPAATLTPYLYAQIGFAMLAGWLVFAHVPDSWSLAGIALVALCGALGAWLTVRERRIPLEPIEA